MTVCIPGSLACASLGCTARALQHTSRARAPPAAATQGAPDCWQPGGAPWWLHGSCLQEATALKREHRDLALGEQVPWPGGSRVDLSGGQVVKTFLTPWAKSPCISLERRAHHGSQGLEMEAKHHRQQSRFYHLRRKCFPSS